MMQEMVRTTLNTIVNDLKKDKYTSGVLLVLLIAGLGYGIKRFLHTRVVKKEQAAHMNFSHAFEDYLEVVKKTEKGATEKKQWDDISFAFEDVQKQHAGTAMAEYAQLVNADIKAREGNLIAAIDLYKNVADSLGSDSPFYYPAKTKAALLMFDVDQVQQGLEALKVLSEDENNTIRDTAVFFLGYYHWSQKNSTQAKAVWAYFDTIKTNDHEKKSPWDQLVSLMLNSVSA